MLGAAVAAAAGAYWLYGAKDAKKNRKLVRGWMLKARGEVLDAVEAAVKKSGSIDKSKYAEIVRTVVARYSRMAGASAAETKALAKELQAAWSRIQKAGAKGAHARAKKRSSKR